MCEDLERDHRFTIDLVPREAGKPAPSPAEITRLVPPR
jgi:hypothetical protein